MKITALISGILWPIFDQVMIITLGYDWKNK